MKKLIWAIVVLSLACVTASAQELSSANVSTYLGNSRWSWTVFLTGPKEALETVSYVEYTLHPTFPNPVQRVDRTADPRYPFGLTATGWGTFTVGIKVVFKNGQVRELSHMLQFVSASQNPCGPPIKLLSQNLAFLADKRFASAPVMIYVNEIRNEWTKGFPTLTLYYGPTINTESAGLRMAVEYARLHSPEGAPVSSAEFQLLRKTLSPNSTWAMTVHHAGDAVQFRYGAQYYLLTVTKVNAGLGDKNYLDLQICEGLPSGAR